MTSRLAQGVEVLTEQVDGITIELNVVDGIGPGATEQQLGADIVGILRVSVGDLRVTKGFLAQAKRSGTQGLHFDRYDEDKPEKYSHWFYRGALELPPSGVVQVTRPSADLEEQCENMLKVTPASYVFVYDLDQIAVVSASAVRAMRSKPTNTKTRTPLGTKRLDDFFVHFVDSFVGDPSLTASDAATVQALAIANQAATGLLLTVQGDTL